MSHDHSENEAPLPGAGSNPRPQVLRAKKSIRDEIRESHVAVKWDKNGKAIDWRTPVHPEFESRLDMPLCYTEEMMAVFTERLKNEGAEYTVHDDDVYPEQK